MRKKNVVVSRFPHYFKREQVAKGTTRKNEVKYVLSWRTKKENVCNVCSDQITARPRENREKNKRVQHIKKYEFALPW